MEGILGAADSTLLAKHEKLKKRVETLETTMARLEQQLQAQSAELAKLRSSPSAPEPKKDVGTELIQMRRNFEVRTRKHIAMVQRNLALLAQANEDVAGQLADRGEFRF
jgi:chromosome segregation ATPase